MPEAKEQKGAGSTESTAPEQGFPPAPWALAGQMYGSLWLVPAETCAVPSDPELVPIQVAGRVCVVAGFVEYQQGSVLTYREAYAGVLVRHPASGLTGLTVNHIWVDDATSLRGGRALWGVPKELARFDFDHQAPGGGFVGKAWDPQGRTLIEGRFTSGLGLPGDTRTRVGFPGLQRLRGEVHSAAAEFESSPRMARADITVPQDSPLATLGIAGRRPLVSFAMKDFRTSLAAAVPVRAGQAAGSSLGEFLQGKVCLVTGGAQGIGWATARALAAAGGTVHVGDVSEEHLATAREQAKQLPWPERFHFTRCDVSERKQVEAWCAGILKEAGRIDVLINNAAFVRWQDVLDMSVEDVERTMQVGFHAIAYTTKAVLPTMRAAGGGHIVNIGSSAGRIFAGASSAAYSAVKAAVDGYTQTLQVELKGSPVHVMLVRPGTVAGTDFFRKHVPSSRMPRLADFVPPLAPEEVAQAILQGLAQRTPIVDIPRSLSVFYTLFEHAPGVMRWLLRQGGSARSDFSKAPNRAA
jgi:NAD(P)-dependent dehydrogenase (short-subunit alcohol dehydrogenase family)